MHLFQILLPRADNDGRPFEREAFDRVKEELAARFDGVTTFRRQQRGCGERVPTPPSMKLSSSRSWRKKPTCPIGAPAAPNWSAVSGKTG